MYHTGRCEMGLMAVTHNILNLRLIELFYRVILSRSLRRRIAALPLSQPLLNTACALPAMARSGSVHSSFRLSDRWSTSDEALRQSSPCPTSRLRTLFLSCCTP